MSYPSRSHRGQTLLLALAVLFLLVLLGGIFITSVVRNLHRTTQQTETDDAVTEGLAGIQYAAQQFHTSEDGADWRPVSTEFLWRTPVPPTIQLPFPSKDPRWDLNQDGVLNGDELRRMDPDYDWLSDNGTYVNPYVRVGTGRGRFLVRVSYVPSYQSSSSSNPNIFDSNSMMVHVEAIGRAGDWSPLDPNDPTTLPDPTQARIAGQVNGSARKVEAWVPLGLVDQLWWITDFTKDRGPATLGVPAFTDANGNPVEYQTVFQGGGIRSDVDLQWQGANRIHLYPSRGEGINVKGKIFLTKRSNVPTPDSNAGDQVLIDVDSDSTTTAGTVGPAQGFPANTPVIPPDSLGTNPANAANIEIAALGDSDSAVVPYNPIRMATQGLDARNIVSDSQHEQSGVTDTTRSIRSPGAPQLDQTDAATGINRWLRLTRDSGTPIVIQDNGASRTVNTGWYSLTDQQFAGLTVAQSTPLRARGLYLDNFDDIQHPSDRADVVKDDWLKPSPEAGWLSDYYIPSETNSNPIRPVADVYFTWETDASGNPTKPVIRITRADTDERQLNLFPDAGRDRKFYSLTGATTSGNITGTLNAVGFTRDFDYPTNGVFYAEGSIRVRGSLGVPALSATGLNAPRSLTVVSGGTIYVEGNVICQPGWYVGLLAHDYVALNPTAFTRVRPGDHVAPPDANAPGPNGQPTGYHFTLQPSDDLDFTVASANPLSSGILYLKHSAVHADSSSETPITLNLPFLGSVPSPPWPDWTRDRFQFGSSLFPPPNGTPPFVASPDRYYVFHEVSPGSTKWTETNTQVPDFEGRAFLMPQITSSGALIPGQDATFRLVSGLKDDPNNPINGLGVGTPTTTPDAQPYWLSRVAVLPQNGPLPIRIDAVIYAYTGSWFVIPPPFFNDNTADTRTAFNAQTDTSGNHLRAQSIQPRWVSGDRGGYPFYDEALNVNIQLNGAVTENMPAEPQQKAQWTDHTWNFFSNTGGHGTPGSIYNPNLRYTYDPTLRWMARVRFTNPYAANNFREDEVVWTAPGNPPAGMRTLAAAQAEAVANNSYAETLPLLPGLPAGNVMFEGNPL